jgi:SAM-dependent methyltransferase
MTWFEEWFNSPYYHLLYENRSEKEAADFIQRISTALQIPVGSKILDAACGKGRHSRILLELGFEVTGIDISQNSIQYAKQFESDFLKFEEHDMREIFARENFDYVFNLFSSFGYCDSDDEDYKAVKAFAGNLKTGGTLVLDYINTELALKIMKPREIVSRGEIHFHIQKRLENGFIKKKIEFLVNSEDHRFQEQLKIIDLFKFEQMFEKAGLTLQKTFGDYELNDFISSTSPRLIMVAIKRHVQ